MGNGRTTFIVGAGAPLDLDLSDGILVPTTLKITEAVCNPYINYFDRESPISLVADIHARLKAKFPIPDKPWWEDSADEALSNINFEQLFHVLEMLYAYQWAWRNQCCAPGIYPVFAPFIQPDFEFDGKLLGSVMEQFILRIMDIVNAYDLDFRQDPTKHGWYRDFFREFGKNADIFNLNYDTTIEESIGAYEDGYESDSEDEKILRFNPRRLLTNAAGLPTVNHLHGCINYYFSTYKDANRDIYTNQFHDLYKYQDYETVRKFMIGRSRSQPHSQSGEQYYAAPIITGLRKTDKLNSVPFDFYHTKLSECIVSNSRLVIIGYGFGDLYCNQLLERMHALHSNDSRIVLIDYWNIPNEYRMRHGDEALSEACGRFICKNMCCGDFDRAMKELYENEKKSGVQCSTNGCLLVFSKGFKNASESINMIADFLDS